MLLGVGVAPVLGHAQLVSSVPGAGAILGEPPLEVRLVFSEPIDARFAGLDLQDADGTIIGRSIGSVDAADPHVLVASLGALDVHHGTFTVTWRVLSAADGHATSGFVTFGVGEDAVVGDAGASLDAGVSHGHPTTEVEVRLIGALGPMLATGLAMFGWLVVRPVTRRASRRVASIQALALGAGGIGALLIGVVAGGAAGIDPPTYLSGTRTGGLLLDRAVLGFGGAALVALLVRLRRPAPAMAVGAGSGAASLALIALGGHAAAFDAPAPVLVMVVHLVAASTWLAGVLGLADLAVLGARPRRIALRRLVPRFSALALVAVALIGLTGLYSALLEAGDPLGGSGTYAFSLRLKVITFVAALGLGAFNYIDGGRRRPWVGGFDRRIAIEAGLALGVVVLAGNLAAGAPPGISRAIPIEPAASSSSSTLSATLALQPGRPGPNRYWATLADPPPAGAALELLLLRTDGTSGEAAIQLRPVGEDASGAVRSFVADGGLLPANSRWAADVVVLGTDGVEASRSPFLFALDDATISAGRAVPPLEPGIVVAALLLASALLALGFVLAGGRVPRADPRAGRSAMLVGGLVGGALGIAILVSGPRF